MAAYLVICNSIRHARIYNGQLAWLLFLVIFENHDVVVLLISDSGIVLEFSCLLVDLILDWLVVVIGYVSNRLTAWHFNDVASAHWTYLQLSEPFS
jgi:hypothetical protein